MEVRFQNFRCFKDTGRIPIRPITLLVGENSSGKTSFLAGLNHLFGLLEGSQIDLNTPPFELGSFRDISFRSPRSRVSKNFTYQHFSGGEETATWHFEDDRGDTRLMGSSFESREMEYLALGPAGIDVRLRLSEDQRRALISLGFNVVKRRNFDVYSITPPDDLVKKKGNVRGILSFPNIFTHHRFVPFLLEEWIEILSDHLKEAEAKNQVKLKPRSIFIEFDRKLMLMIRRRGTPRRMYKAFAPIRETPQRVYLHESSIINSRDVRGELTAKRLMKLSQSSEDNWDSLKSDLNEFGRKSGLFEEIYPHALVRKSQYPFEIRLRTKHAQTSNLCDVG